MTGEANDERVFALIAFSSSLCFLQRINATELTFTYIFNDEISLSVTETIRIHTQFIERVDVNIKDEEENVMN